MLIEKLVVGAFEANCYILYGDAGNSCLVIDPGDESGRILNRLNALNLKAEAVILSHGHPDHILAAPELKKETGASIMMHQGDSDLVNDKTLAYMLGMKEMASIQPDRLLEDGQVVEAAGFKVQVIYTPGHSRGSICLLHEDKLFSGDLLFCGGVGRFDLPGGNDKELRKSLDKIVKLPPETKVYPGHGPETTIEAEYRGNFYLANLFK